MKVSDADRALILRARSKIWDAYRASVAAEDTEALRAALAKLSHEALMTHLLTHEIDERTRAAKLKRLEQV